jgi:hypothetical protein
MYPVRHIPLKINTGNCIGHLFYKIFTIKYKSHEFGQNKKGILTGNENHNFCLPFQSYININFFIISGGQKHKKTAPPQVPS